MVVRRLKGSWIGRAAWVVQVRNGPGVRRRRFAVQSEALCNWQWLNAWKLVELIYTVLHPRWAYRIRLISGNATPRTCI